MAKLAFSTSACPEWSLYQVATNAQLLGFAGVEIRAHEDNRHFSPQACNNEAQLLGRVFRRTGVSIFSISTTFQLGSLEPMERVSPRLQHLVQLARSMGAHFVRVRLPKPARADNSYEFNELAAELTESAAYAKAFDVSLAIETRGAWSSEKRLFRVAECLDQAPGACLLLNIRAVCLKNPRRWTRLCRRVRPHIGYVRVSDGYRNDAHSTPFAPIGSGEVPVKSAIQWLRSEGFRGYINFEWDRIAHPALETPEVALPRFAHSVLRYWRLKKKHALLV